MDLRQVSVRRQGYREHMDVRRWELNPDARRSGWRYWLDVALAVGEWVALAAAVVVFGVVLGIRALS